MMQGQIQVVMSAWCLHQLICHPHVHLLLLLHLNSSLQSVQPITLIVAGKTMDGRRKGDAATKKLGYEVV